ncbi:TonB-dependent receptor [Chitinophaga flava]|uniref:SusC/RagA family TonB-linked outer membrane protein n=1 Tax=Chitinophaga flava TaxID=2259036 RepID=A0A365XR41_9BACT|nr:TonB-dependent receptor [Chitinophaga flava]RBL88826.1 SusC/RagA family TonB-linked outer membrane protein [Chitinophaga flava]
MQLKAIGNSGPRRHWKQAGLPNKLLLVMKLTSFFLLMAVLQVSANSSAQTITWSARSASLQKVFNVIRQQTGYAFFYDKEDLKNTQPVTVELKNASLQSAMEQVMQRQTLSYEIQGNTVFITRNDKPAHITTLSTPPPPPVTISGKVVDENGTPVPGASIMVKGTTKGAITNASGEFQLANVDDNAVVTVTSIGYISKEISLNGKTHLSISLAADVSTLKQMVVVGYGTQKKANLTGSVASVGSKELANRPVSSVSSALQGTMPGVTVTAAVSGQPGADQAKIRIRGIGTLNNADPVIVIDGVITNVSNLNNINPDDIASMSVLKDAASASIYGSRAANGVILITTKQGKKGKAQLSYNAYVGKQKPTGLPDFLPSWQVATLENQAALNEGKTAKYTPDQIAKFKDGSDPFNYPNTDWLGLFYKGNDIQQNHYLSMTGGTEKTQYALSLGLFDQNGVVKKTNAKRYTTRLNLTSEVANHVKVNANIGFTSTGQKEPSNPYTGDFSQLVRQINRINPRIPYKYANGQYGAIGDGNPMAWLEGNSLNQYAYYDLVGNVGVDWEIVKDLHFKPSLAYVMKINHNKKFRADQQYYNADGDPTFYQGPSSVTDENTFGNTITQQALLEYSKSFSKHNFKILGGYSREQTKYTFNDGYRKGYLNNQLTDLNLGSTDGQTASGYSYELGLESFFGRLNYDYDGKYLLEANLRYDGASRFASSNRWGVFPSFSAGWNIDREAFFEPVKQVVSNLKLRASWGQLGNQYVKGKDDTKYPTYPYYPYIPTYNGDQNYVFGGPAAVVSPGVAQINGVIPDIKWETTTETGVGIDAGFLDGKLSFTADYFHKLTSDILLAIPVAATYGLNQPIQNAGAVLNSGWEFVLGYNNRKGDFSYSASFNTAFIHNEITDLHGAGPIIDGYTFQQVGYPVNALYGYIADGIYQSKDEVKKGPFQSTRTGPGDIRYRDRDGNDTINAADRQYLGNYFPKVTFGLNLSGSWKNFDISVFLQGAAGVKTYIDAGKIGAVGGDANKPTSALLDTWTADNPNASMPRIWYTYKQNDPSNTPSSFWVKDGSYLRLKNLQIGYTLPEKLTKRAGIGKVRFYYSGQNILTFDHLYSWIDPEASIRSSIYYYPQVKVHTFGVNVSF